MKYTPPLNLHFDDEKHIYTEVGTLKPLTGVTNILKNISKGDAFPAWGAKETADYITKNIEPITFKLNLGEHKDLESFMKTAKAQWREQSKSAKEVGSAVHEYIEGYYKGHGVSPEEYLQGLEMPHTELLEVKRCITAFLDWNALKKPKIIYSELRVASKEHWYAGTLDFLFEIDGKLVLGDFKTSKARKESKAPYKEFEDARSIYPDYWLQLAAYQIALEEGGITPQERMVVRLDKSTGKAHYFTAPTDLEFDKKSFLNLREFHKWGSYVENNLN